MQLLKHFKELTVHPKNAQELKGLILQLAIQGKLTKQWREQNPNVEPASVLLERIQKEKAQLVKEKKIKKEKPLPEIEEDEIPFDLPQKWCFSRLGSMGLINPRNTIADNLEIGFVPMRDISQTFSSVPKFEIKEWLSVKKAFTHFRENDVAFAKITPCFENSKACVFKGLPNGFGAGTTELHVFRKVTEEVHSEFVYCIVKSPLFLKNGEDKMTGSAGQKRVPKDYFSHYLIGLPPFEEQKAIVATVNQLFEEVEALEKQTQARVQLKEDFVTSALQQLATGDTVKEWSFLQAHFKTFFTEKTAVKKLRETILQLAVQGKLTHHWRLQNSPPLEEYPEGEVFNSPPLEGCPQGGVVHTAPDKSSQDKVVKRNAKNYFSLPYNPALKERAKALRKAGNLSEVLFWNEVKRKQFKGLDFDRQKIIGNYIVDFYCPNCQVVIEIDGSSHDHKQAYDAKRDAYLEGLGLTVIHIPDIDIKKKLAYTMNALMEHPALVVGEADAVVSPHAAETVRAAEPPRAGESVRAAEPPRPAGTPPEEGNWEPASVLLERIKTEKEQLIRDKKIKKEKPLPPITDEEIPYPLPKGWVWCRLGDLMSITGGVAKGKNVKGEIIVSPYLRVANVQRGFLNLDLVKEIAVSSIDYKKYQIEIGDLLMIEGGDPDKVGRCAIWNDEIQGCIHQNHVFRVRGYLKGVLFNRFLMEFINSPNTRRYYEDCAKRTTNLASINKTQMRSTPIALPPKEEQKAIVEKVNAMMGLCDALEQEIEQSTTQVEQLMQSCLREVFEG
ncbi:DUF559 domain-containing protein [Reichenbachiella agarivorans]|uniref:DUF559 domain-containing protein n=1 Tax=Reichenbachiella agarivorans TaxID=2979464 RepID=A0ABY6CKU1_9BACT|nr:DUF559 domain-containing protein [Reichenbachiella agarivorans]UXP31146.1 DUF559 domain-containing protein [Reichenbachiella agarivorans]